VAAANAAVRPGAQRAGNADVPQAWRARAKELPPLAQMLDLVGLKSVKEDMFNLADQVRWFAAAEAVCTTRKQGSL